jgi:hypothetical protein
MHTQATPAAVADKATGKCASDAISLHRDPRTDEWVFDLSPGLDLLEVARVLSVVQQHALQLLQQQLHNTAAVNAAAAVGTAAPVAETSGNQFAQL